MRTVGQMLDGRPKAVRVSGLNLSVLDAIRGLAALYVVLHHARWLLWTSQKQYVTDGGHGLGLAVASLSAIFIYGHQAVLLFFLVSGFCIHYRQARTMHLDGATRAPFSVVAFALRRFRRLYPTLLLALAFTAILDRAGMQFNPDFYAGNASAPTIQAALHVPQYSLPVIIGNLLMQASLAVRPFGTNDPLWSLAFEFWFYALYPVVLWLSRRHAALMVSVAGLVSLVSLCAGDVLPAPGWVISMLSYWFVWALGSFVAEIYVGRVRLIRLRWIALPSSLLTLGVLGDIALRHADVIGVDAATEILLSLGFGGLLASALLGMPSAMATRIEGGARRISWLGNVSYSLYAVHYPLLALVSAIWLSHHDSLPQGAELAMFGTAAALVLGWCSWYMVERHFVSAKSVLQVRARSKVEQTSTLMSLGEAAASAQPSV